MPCALCVCWINLTRSRWNAVFVICWRERGRADCSKQVAVAVHWKERSWKTKLVFKRRSLPRTLLHPPLKFRHHVTHTPNLPARHYSFFIMKLKYLFIISSLLPLTGYQYKPFIFLWQSLPNQQSDPTYNELCPIKFNQVIIQLANLAISVKSHPSILDVDPWVDPSYQKYDPSVDNVARVILRDYQEEDAHGLVDLDQSCFYNYLHDLLRYVILSVVDHSLLES